MKKFKVIVYGLGEIGKEAAKLALSRGSIEVVAAYDIDPKKIGRDLGEVIGASEVGTEVKNSEHIYSHGIKADIALHMTQSSCKDVYAQIMTLLGKGYNVISSCEELAYPWLKHANIALAFEKRAKDEGVTLLGTGVNPGFVMDRLPLVMTGMCKEVGSIQVERVVNAGERRRPLQEKVGAGMEVEEFRRLGLSIGHKGFSESVAVIAAGLGLELDGIEETIDCKVAEEDLKTEHFEIRKGQVTGIDQHAIGRKGGKEVITLHLQMYAGNHKTYDRIRIDGTPPIDVKIEGGLHGDRATVASLVNSIPEVVDAEPGLLTVDKLSCPVFFK